MDTLMLMILALLSIAFAITHIGMCRESYRGRMVERMGEWGFRGLYSLVSIVTLGGAIWIYKGLRGEGQALWNMPAWAQVCPMLLALLAIILLVFGFIQRSPTGMGPASMEPRGVNRITRHPVNMGIALFALAHVIAIGKPGDVVFWGSIFIVGFLGAYHQDGRKARELDDEFGEYKVTTSIFPFAAILTRKTKLNLGEFNKVLLIICFLIWLGLIIFHKKFIGAGVFG